MCEYACGWLPRPCSVPGLCISGKSPVAPAHSSNCAVQVVGLIEHPCCRVRLDEPIPCRCASRPRCQANRHGGSGRRWAHRATMTRPRGSCRLPSGRCSYQLDRTSQRRGMRRRRPGCHMRQKTVQLGIPAVVEHVGLGFCRAVPPSRGRSDSAMCATSKCLVDCQPRHHARVDMLTGASRIPRCRGRPRANGGVRPPHRR